MKAFSTSDLRLLAATVIEDHTLRKLLLLVLKKKLISK